MYLYCIHILLCLVNILFFLCNVTLREMQQVSEVQRAGTNPICVPVCIIIILCNNLCIYKYKQKACLNTLIEKELFVSTTRRRIYGKLTFSMEYFQPIQCKFFINYSIFNKV